ncbi:uncharacterized protein LOC131890470 [Tigriopus californicus]|uniref:uncharacterized protein LOC131890470 n=1 Tax=Tigriopus californicus TaxID=6832 RepID=UPI0027D9E695|nr:uncharacterized protein LOC131890470 [Tigriopus californicus]
MGCATSKTNSQVSDGQVSIEGPPKRTRVKKKVEDSANNNHGPPSSGDDGVSLGSIGSDISRPPTPFSRPLTAKVAQRPSTTTIFEDGSRGSQSNLKDRKRNSSDPHAFLSVKSQSLSATGANSSIKDESNSLSSSSARSRKSQNEDILAPSGLGARKLSGKMNGADEEDIRQLKAFLKEKGL